MAATTNHYRHQDYTIAWICALPLEMAAAEAMLDERHHDLPARPNDDNSYILGKINAHNVVIACLPYGVYGTTSATTVAAQMSSSFESLRFFLMVGIGGGAPSKKDDIRLGDVVVSKPTRNLGGVIQYDFGKAMSGDRFERIGVLNKPPPVLLSAISKLQATHMSKPSKISSIISEIATVRSITKETFAHPGEDQDMLFDQEYDHPGAEETCNKCSMTRLLQRPGRFERGPVIHYGLIASGNQVIKDSRIRDKLVQELGVLCFEMEAAGLMDNFPCLVIRGICDYSDSHKNKQWQNYAAATAAAYTKELLSVVHASQVADTPPAESEVAFYVGDTPSRLNRSASVIRYQNTDEKLLEEISSYEHERIHRKLSQKRLVGTTQWFLNHPDFKAWLTGKEVSSLWCSGKIGSGKTMIATAVIEAVKYQFSQFKSPTVFFYCDHEYYGTLDASYIVSSFIKQICEFLYQKSGRYPVDVARDLNKFFGPRRTPPDFDDLQNVFLRLFRTVPDTSYIIDGIDALREDHAKRLLKFIQRLFCSPDLSKRSRIMLLSRDQVPGYINIDTLIYGIRRISISANAVQDIKNYIETSVTEKMMYRRLTDDISLLEEIKETLFTESSNMFLWVFLQIEIVWDTCRTDADIRSALAMLPKDIKETYNRCVGRIDFRDSWALKVLKWVSFAKRPLGIEELREAVAFELTDTKWNADKKPQRNFIIGCCANLVVLDPIDNCVRFAHSSVRQYLEEDRTRAAQERFVPGYPTEDSGDLECGEYCVSYLSFSDFNLQLTRAPLDKTAVTIAPPLSIAQAVSSTALSKLFYRQPQNQKNPISVSFRTIRTLAAPNRTQYIFLNYVVTNWAMHTKEIHRASSAWEKFEQLATCFNETWNFHPWAPGGRSKVSRLHGLFGWAVREQHKPFLSIVQELGSSLRHFCDLPLVDEGLPAIHIASKLGYKDIIKILLKFCDVNNVDQDGCTSLHHAAGKGHTEITRLLLLQKGIKLNVNSKFHCTPLWLAASYGHEDIIPMLIEKGASVEVKDMANRRTPLSRAVENGHCAVVSLLLDKGALIESRDTDGQTPLELAIKGRNNTMIDLLLKYGAKFGYKDNDNQSLLLTVTKNGLEPLVKLLIEKGTTYNGEELISLAIQNSHPAVLKLLLEKGILAVQSRHPIVVKLILENGASYDTENLMSLAVQSGNLAMISLFLEKGISCNSQQLQSLAIESGNSAVVELILENGGSHDAESLLLLAIQSGNLAMIKLLLEAGISCKSQHLSLAIESDNPAVAELILENGIESGNPAVVEVILERGKSHDAESLLLRAVQSGHSVVVQLLLEKGISYNHHALMQLAVQSGHSVVVQLLLEKGISYNCRELIRVAIDHDDGAVVKILLKKTTSFENQELLLWATKKGYTIVVELLLEIGTDPNTKDAQNITPLHWAILFGKEAIALLLLEYNANINTEDNHKQTPLYWAAKIGQEEMVKLLLHNNASVNIGDIHGRTPLHRVALSGNKAITELLLEKGASIDAKDKFGVTPLHWAVEQGQEEIAKFLVENGASIDAQNNDGETSLHYAVEYGREIIAKLLIDNGVNVNAQDYRGRTPLYKADQNSQRTFKKLLLKNGGRIKIIADRRH